MRSHHLLLMFAGATLFLAGALLAVGSGGEPAPVATRGPAEVAMHRVLVARADLRSGRFLQDGDFTWGERPANTLRPDLFIEGSDGPGGLAGAILLADRRAGEAIQRGDVVSPRDQGFLAAVLPPGMRSLSVQVDEVSGSPGLIYPGDRVDVIVTHTLGNEAEPARRIIGQTVLANVRVLAVDRAMDGPGGDPERGVPPAQPAGGGGGFGAFGGGAAGGGGATAAGGPGAAAARRSASQQQQQQQGKAARTVSLEVDPRQAEVLSVAVTLGRITLSLRSLQQEAGPTVAPETGAVWAGDVIDALYSLSRRQSTSSSGGVMVLRGRNAEAARPVGAGRSASGAGGIGGARSAAGGLAGGT